MWDVVSCMAIKASCSLCAGQVPCEPVWASRAGRIWVPQWMGMLGAAETLIQRVAALEILLEENYQVTPFTCAG